jgi:hypothetical protein
MKTMYIRIQEQLAQTFEIQVPMDSENLLETALLLGIAKYHESELILEPGEVMERRIASSFKDELNFDNEIEF